MSRLIKFLNEKKTKFDALNKWKSDIRRLNKIYNNIDNESDFQEAQKTFTTFSKNFEKWVFEELLKNDEKTPIQQEIRKTGWQAAIFMGTEDLFPDFWYYKTDRYHPDLDKLKKNRKKNVNKINKLFRDFFKAAEEYFETDYMQNVSPREHTINKYGINFVISKDAPREEYLKQWFNVYLPKDIEILNKKGLQRAYRDLTVVIKSKLPGNYAGTYDANSDIVNLSSWALLSKEKTFIHEVGHRVYFNLPSNAIKVWDDTLYQLTSTIEREDFKKFFNKYQDQIYKSFEEFDVRPIKNIKLGQISDLVERYKFEFIHKKLGRTAYFNIENKEDLYNHYKKFIVGERLHLGFDIENYATTNSWEGFAEAFAFYVLKPQQLNWFIRTLLINTLRASGYKLNESKQDIETKLMKDFKEGIDNEIQERW